MKNLYCRFSLFMAKKHDLMEKKIRTSRAVAVERKNCATPSLESFGSRPHLG
jgi:hypothetical protein